MRANISKSEINKSVEVLDIYIGFDQAESIAYHTLCHSILSRASVPVRITPIKLSMLRGIHNRPLDVHQSNEFSFTRFLVPFLNGYKGKALFMDCDMLLTTDIKELFDEIDIQASVSVVKHEYEPKDNVKYLGTTQYKYEKKNWSSVMVFNCGHLDCKKLTPEYVDKASGLELHGFKWTKEELIGELNKDWNHLVSEYDPNPNAKIIHWTVGGPYFYEYEYCEHAETWFNERALMKNCNQLPEIVGAA